MRKLILIAAIAFTATTPCYANLTMASAEPSAAVAEVPNAPAAATPAAIAPTPTATARPVRSERPAKVSRPRQHHWSAPDDDYGYGYSYRRSYGGGC